MLSMALQTLEMVLNTYLRLDEETIARLREIEGKKIKLEITDWGIGFFIVTSARGVELHREIGDEPDTVISGKLDALFWLGWEKANNTALFRNKVDISGDMHTGEKLRNILAQMDIDWEEQLSRLVGDIAAYKVGSFFRGIAQASQKARDSVKENINDFLRFEANVLPSDAEVKQFIDETSALRDAVERLEARINRLDQGNEETC